ncbi:hypothetical protein [Rhodococcus erythropolis]|uniref:hypothetical protein n=1 Tax=Rhodococcus erythropolis TaxID=1833 RepID=UPI003670333B
MIARPGSRYRWINTAETLGLALLVSGVVLAVLGVLALPLGFLTAGANPFELLFPVVEETNNEPTNWLVQAGGWAVFGGFGLSLVGQGLDVAAKKGTARADIVTVGAILSAPEQLATPLVRALDAAETIRGSATVLEGWLTGIDLDAALWNLAEEFGTGVRLDTELRAVYGQVAGSSVPNFRAQVDAAKAAVLACTQRLSGSAQRLVDVADLVGNFDRELSEPVRRAALAQERNRRAQRAREQLAKLTVTRTARENIEPIVDDVVDIATGQLDGYNDLPEIEKL